MNIAQPIRQVNDLENIKNYYKKVKQSPRNELLVVLGLNTALRISDILSLTWNAVYDFERECYRKHIVLTEQKTEKRSQIYINRSVLEELRNYRAHLEYHHKVITPETFLFSHSNKNVPITRVQAFRIIKQIATYYELPEIISCHSLRKTFGYHAWKQGIPPVLLVTVFNHSSFQITKRYLGIEQDDKDNIFKKIIL